MWKKYKTLLARKVNKELNSFHVAETTIPPITNVQEDTYEMAVSAATLLCDVWFLCFLYWLFLKLAGWDYSIRVTQSHVWRRQLSRFRFYKDNEATKKAIYISSIHSEGRS